MSVEDSMIAGQHPKIDLVCCAADPNAEGFCLQIMIHFTFRGTGPVTTAENFSVQLCHLLAWHGSALDPSRMIERRLPSEPV